MYLFQLHIEYQSHYFPKSKKNKKVVEKINKLNHLFQKERVLKK